MKAKEKSEKKEKKKKKKKKKKRKIKQEKSLIDERKNWKLERPCWETDLQGRH